MGVEEKVQKLNSSLPAAADSRQPCEDALIKEYLDATIGDGVEEFDRVLTLLTW